MADWTATRRTARERREELAGKGELLPAEELLALACDAVALSAVPLPTGDALLAGAFAVLDRDAGCIWHDGALPPETTRFNIAHELAHWWLHEQASACGALDIIPDPVSNPLPYGEAYVSGYSPAQRRETEANIFAAEFLAPAPLLRDLFLAGRTARQIADETGIGERTVLGQLAETLIQYSDEARSPLPNQPPAPITPDPTQRTAAEVSEGPMLVIAGPGTGKTRTLISRISHLLERGTPPEQILALTFSNRAADEMRKRLSEQDPEAGRRVWIGTFHAFGLELLRRFGTRVGLPASPALLDPLDAVSLLERHVGDFGLEEYEYLHDPALPLRDMLGAISRAKDELKSPEEYALLARAMADSASSDENALAAKKAGEVARVYAAWQQILEDQGKLDLGDLLFRSVLLLEQCPEVLGQLRSEYREILVDEYQDINRASAVLVRLLAGEGKGLWAVGDLRQAIYQFRGASPANVARFEQDFPTGRRLELGVNYRSQPPVVQLFSAAAAGMEQDESSTPGTPWTPWTPQRSGREPVTYAEAEDERAQVEGIAAAIRANQGEGLRYSDQAILCRTNSQAEGFAIALEECGIPTLYLGDLLARPEVKDMLALLSLASEGHGQGLHRVARFVEYAVPSETVQELLETSSDEPLLKRLAVSEETGFRRIHEHVTPLAFAGDAFAFLSRYLFGPAGYLRDLYRDDTVANRQRRIALYQLLQIARSHGQRLELEEERPQRAFLTYVRRLLATGEDQRAKLPAGAEEIDGVRLMTVHASKGLEFPVVFLPNLAQGMFPPRKRSGMVTLPDGLAVEAPADDGEEEARLFFVAISRARDRLVLSRPLNVRGKPREGSPLLALIGEALETDVVQRVRWSGVERVAAMPAREPSAASEQTEFRLAEVEQYMVCPRQYYYQRVLRLPTGQETSPYQAFHRSVAEVLRWMSRQAEDGNELTEEACDRKLSEQWAATGPGDHPFSSLLLARAEKIIRGQRNGARPWQTETELQADVDAALVSIRPDAVYRDPDGTLVVERHHAGRESDDHARAPRLALLRRAAQREAAGAGDVRVRIRYLASGEVKEIAASPRYEPARVAKYAEAVRGIRAGEFEPEPSDAECPRCPYYFICPL